MKKQENVVANLISNDLFADSLLSLMDRWRSENKYEDWKYYENEMKKLVEDKNLSFVKGTKRPFGCIVSNGVIKFKVFIKLRGNFFSLCAKLVKYF